MYAEVNITWLEIAIILKAGLNTDATDNHPNASGHDASARDIANGAWVVNSIARVHVTIDRVVLIDIDAELDLQVFDARGEFFINNSGAGSAATNQAVSSQHWNAGDKC